VFAAAGDEPAFPDDAVEVARIVGAWGVKGGIKVKPLSADPQALFSTKRWYLRAPLPLASAVPRAPARPAAAPGKLSSWPRLLRVVQAREQGAHVVATAQDMPDRDAAEALAGARVFVSRASFPTPGTDEFYWVDLIGLAVRNREAVELGTVTGLVETGPTCVLRVQPPASVAGTAEPAPERLIPFVSAYVDRVDTAGRCVHVDWQADY